MLVEAKPDKWQINHICAKSISLVLISPWRSDQVETLAESQALEHGLSHWGFHLPFPAVCTARERSGEVSGAAELVSSNFQMWFPDVLRVYFPANPGFAALLCQFDPWDKALSTTGEAERGEPCGRTRRWLWSFECFAGSGLARGTFHASALLGFINKNITCIWRQDLTVCKLLCFHFCWFSHCKNIPKPNQILVLVW